jgi:hypothetical protein
VCDKANLPVALGLAGASKPGTRQFHDCRYRLTLQRTDAAVAGGFSRSMRWMCWPVPMGRAS